MFKYRVETERSTVTTSYYDVMARDEDEAKYKLENHKKFEKDIEFIDELDDDISEKIVCATKTQE